VEKAQNERGNMLAWQFGSLDAMTKHLAHALAGCVTVIRGLNLNQKELASREDLARPQVAPCTNPSRLFHATSFPLTNPRGH